MLPSDFSFQKFTPTIEPFPSGENASPLFPVEGGAGATVHPKTVVYGVEFDKSYKAYLEEKMKAEGEIEDELGEAKINISYNNGNVSVVRQDTGEEIAATRLFWFAWEAFRPETELY